MEKVFKSMENHAAHGISGFELTKIVLHNLKHFKLKPQTKTVLWVLVDCYNPENGSVVFPSMEYIAQEGDMGLTSAKAGIKELISKGLIIKSKRGKIKGNYNKYLLTPKVQNPTSKQPENELLKQSDSDRFMIRTNKHEKIKEQTTSNVVAFKTTSSNRRTSITLENVPEIIKNNKKINNPCAYWASLSNEVQDDYIEKQKQRNEQLKRKEEKLQQEIKRLKEKRENEQKFKEECSKPLSELYTYETACNLIKRLFNVEKRLAYQGIAKNLALTFDIDIDKLLNEV